MKKIILAVAVLMLTAPAMATVEICIVDEGSGWVAIEYDSDANVSGLGLDITVTSGNIIEIKDYFVGECDGTTQGFGIFPASFNRNINPDDPNWDDPNYTPVADVCDSGALGGLGTPGITIEMGALYEDGNEPELVGVLCRLKVSEDCNMSAVGNPTRGNVVLEDANEADLDVATCATDIPIALGPPACPTCPGDWDESDTVTFSDLGSFMMVLDQGNTWADIPWPDIRYNACGDWDGNGTMTFSDLGSFMMVLDQGNTWADIPCP